MIGLQILVAQIMELQGQPCVYKIVHVLLTLNVEQVLVAITHGVLHTYLDILLHYYLQNDHLHILVEIILVDGKYMFHNLQHISDH